MKIALIGYGKMGKAIEKIALSKGHAVSFRIDIGRDDELQSMNPSNTDVAIEFTHPGSAFDNIKSCILQNVPVISGTTGWLNKKSEIDSLCRERNATFFYASNFSIGVNLFFRINEMVAGIMNAYPEYNPDITEIHHTEKKDAPSGTAITLAEKIIGNLRSKKSWTHEESADLSKIVIHSIREGAVPGIHNVRYYSGTDQIEIKHEAFSREGFASGAVHVAEWILDKKGVLGMNDFLNI